MITLSVKTKQALVEGKARLYHGGDHSDPAWFTTDKNHAEYFGAVKEYTLQADRVRIITQQESEVMGSGYEADAKLIGLLDGFDAIVVEGWEGEGVCVFAPGLMGASHEEADCDSKESIDDDHVGLWFPEECDDHLSETELSELRAVGYVI